MKTDVDTCLRQIADWYVVNRREMPEPTLEAILLKHCEDEAEMVNFVKFLETEPGQSRFRTLLRERKEPGNPAFKVGDKVKFKLDYGHPDATYPPTYWRSDIREHIGEVIKIDWRFLHPITVKYDGETRSLRAEDLTLAEGSGNPFEISKTRVASARPDKETMFFNVPEAREQLLREGFVYTLRPKMRKTGWDVAYYGSYYKREKIGDVWVSFVREIEDMEELKPYFRYSGFKKLTDWWKAAGGSRFLFRVSFEKWLRPQPGESKLGTPVAKKPWQMTLAEYKKTLIKPGDRVAWGNHYEYVKQALLDGLPVPPEVLADYPELAGRRRSNPVSEVRDYWDTYLENNALRVGPKDTDAGAFLSWMIEAGGDILREWVGKGYVDYAYIQGKVNRIRSNLRYPKDWTDPLSAGEKERLAEVKEDLKGLPAPTTETQAVKALIVAITNRDVGAIGTRLGKVESLLKSGRSNPPVAKKQPWQMTREEFVKIYIDRFKGMLSKEALSRVTEEELQKERREAIEYQKHTIKQALLHGLSVPPDVLADYPELRRYEIPKTRVASLGFIELELPVARAVEALVGENPWSSGFHGALNQRWTIVFRGRVSDKAVKAAEAAGLEVAYRELLVGSGQFLTDVSLPGVGVTEIEKATEVFNRFAELYEKGGNPPVAKEPWQMTRADFLEYYKVQGLKTSLPPELEHRGQVIQAIRLGKPVPPEVLADYPDLAKFVKEGRK